MHRQTHVQKLVNMVSGPQRAVEASEMWMLDQHSFRAAVGLDYFLCLWLMVALTSSFRLHGECGVEPRTNHAD